MSNETYNISGQAGAVGLNAHAHDMTFNQIGSQIEKSMGLAALANELEVLRQALKKEATTEEHDINPLPIRHSFLPNVASADRRAACPAHHRN